MARIHLISVVILMISFVGCVEPSSTKLHDNFFAHKAEFDQLIQLAQEGKGSSSEHLLKMVPLEKTVNVVGLTYLTECLIWFQSYTMESNAKVIDKGYAHLCTTPGDSHLFVQDIDHYEPPKEPYYTAYQKLDDDWYLFLRVRPARQ